MTTDKKKEQNRRRQQHLRDRNKKIEVKTESSDEVWLYNGDPARCLDCCTAGTIEKDGNIAWFEVDEEHKNVRIH
ncbi:hypothetical protein MD588_19345 [Photobacterium sp. SDRW27]|uniref:hypothetical protein n=1 Tax=Photobacterium obscurum TaxID=2829490 RepID=UPI00224448E3|nr:hypothetical protein [Photobacterium obscurum]MCW8330953.1 hypothetical protein [Photobacterium obscurum]